MSHTPSSKRTLKSSATPAGTSSTAQHQLTSDTSSSLQPPTGDSLSTSSPSSTNPRKRRASGQPIAPAPEPTQPSLLAPAPSTAGPQFGDKPSSSSSKGATAAMSSAAAGASSSSAAAAPPAKKGRTNTPWTPTEEQRLKQMRDAGKSWAEIAKMFPHRTEGSVKKHWYKDMHYAEFGEDESAALLAAIKEYDSNKWRVIGQKVGKPAKACEQYAKENFSAK